MRLVLLATDEIEYDQQPIGYHSILGKPVIQHIIEYFVAQNIRKYHIVLHHHPQMIEEILETGQRWGVDITYHLVRDSQEPFSTLIPAMFDWDDDLFLLGDASLLPQINVSSLVEEYSSHGQHIMIASPTNEWTRWALLSRSFFLSLPFKTSMVHLLDMLSSSRSISLESLITARTHWELFETNMKLLDTDGFPLLMPANSRMESQGVWLSHGVVIHPSATILPPVFIGENSVIHQGASIGPYVVIERGCVINNNTHIKRSLVRQKSYVGDHLEIAESVVQQNRLVNLALHSQITVKDDFILSDLEKPNIFHFSLRVVTRTVAVGMIILFSPLILAMFLTHRIHGFKVLYVPNSDDPLLWHECHLWSFAPNDDDNPPDIPTSFLNSLPLLFNIVWGQLHFIGSPPRTIDEVLALPEPWKRLHLRAQLGIITLADVELNCHASPEELFTSEAYYVAHRSLFLNISVCIRWIYRKIVHRKID